MKLVVFRTLDRVPGRLVCRFYSSAAPNAAPSTPPMLLKIREDLKVAMRARDTLRLDVLRGLVAETTNAAKTSTPINSDSRMLSIVRKKMKSSQEAIRECEQAGRTDLKDKEVAQLSILKSYVKDSNVMTEEDIGKAIQLQVDRLKSEEKPVNVGNMIKALIGPGGTLDGGLVDKRRVARIVAETFGNNRSVA